jgi:HD-GYP domain-containing protein (c-di-GMP phosphodiesterase class II)
MTREPVRAAELMAVVATATDFAKGFPEEQALRTCRIAMRLADRAGLDDDGRRAVFYLALLRFVGCTATASEMAAALGDELAVSALFAAVDPRDLRAVLTAASALVGTGAPLPRRVADLVRFLKNAPGVVREHEVASCEVAQLFAERVGLPERVRTALRQVFERFDGRGNPGAAGGPGIDVAVRVEQVANVVELLVRTAGWDAAVAALRKRAGSSFDPELVALVVADPTGFASVAADDLDPAEVLAAEPQPWLSYTGADLDPALAAIGGIADLKSVYTRGHATGVADLASGAARAAGLAEADATLVRRAGWLHDLGRVAVSANVWDKPGPLSPVQWEQVRLHPYVTERVLARCPPLAGIAAVAGAHHERADGSGYHRGLTDRQSTRAAAVLAAADVYRALGEDRPHRGALAPAERLRVMRAERDSGRLAGWAVDAVLAAAGERPTRPARTTEPLTEREREVLALVARGATNRAAAQALGISPKTVNAHLEHVFAKLGVTTRGAATYYAVEHGLLDR